MSIASIQAAERGKRKLRGGHKERRRPSSRKGSVQIKVLVISEDNSTARAMLERLSNDSGHRFEVHVIQDPMMVVRAVERYRPDVIVAQNWYGSSDKDYWDVMMPVLNFHPETKVVVVIGPQSRGRELPRESWYFNDAPVIDRADAKLEDNLSRVILSIV